MNKVLFQIYRILVPKPVRTAILKKRLRVKILKHFAALPENEINNEQKEVLSFLEKNKVRIFPYPFHEKYSPDSIEVIYDREKQMRYVIQDGKRLYFKRRWNDSRIKRAYSDLCREQDPESPHRYLTGLFTVGGDDVIADIGAAEGNFSLSVIDKVRKIYLIEYDKEWSEALRATFAPWAGKVEIINKYVAGTDDGSHVRFDTFYKEKKDITFIKIDVDGAESVVLGSCEELFSSSAPIKIALCTYHKNNDEKDFSLLLRNHGFKITPSSGYMIHYYDKKMKAPFLRRGLLRAVK